MHVSLLVSMRVNACELACGGVRMKLSLLVGEGEVNLFV